MKNLVTILILTATMLLVSCGTKTGATGATGADGKDGTDYTWEREMVKKVAGDSNPCLPGVVCSIEIVKEFTREERVIITKTTILSGPAGVGTETYRAYDLGSYTGGEMDLAQQESMYIGDVRLSTADKWYGTEEVYELTSIGAGAVRLGYGSLHLFSENNEILKDLENMGSNLESLANEDLSLDLVYNYGLSEERAESVAKITSSFQKIQNKRALTSKEMSAYTQKVLGVDYTAGKKALEKHLQGDSDEMEAMIERAADLNGTSPEAVTELVGEHLLN